MNKQLMTLEASSILSQYIVKTPLQYVERLSKKYGASIYFKREDLQKTRSFKIRGSLLKMLLHNTNKNTPYVCASAGNHAQGVSYACSLLNRNGKIFIPTITPEQKKNNIIFYGKNNIELFSFGDTFDDCLNEAQEYCDKINGTFIHPYDDLDIITGQSTIGYEITQECNPDYIICPIGGGGLISGIGNWIHYNFNNCKMIGVESKNADSMYQALLNNNPVKLEKINTFADGVSVKRAGDLTFNFCKSYLSSPLQNIHNTIKVISNEKLCNTIVDIYNKEGIILEPAGALSISALDSLPLKQIKNKTIVCVISGGNNDISRYSEIIEKDLIYQNIKHYYIIEFTQKYGELKKFITNVLAYNDDITRFEYIKKTNREFGNVLLGIETLDNKNLENNLIKNKFKFKKINYDDDIYSYLI